MYDVSVERDQESAAVYYVYQQQQRKQLAIILAVGLVLTDLLLSVGLPALLRYAVRQHSGAVLAAAIVLWACLFTLLAVFFSSAVRTGLNVTVVTFLATGFSCFVLGLVPPHPLWFDAIVMSLFFLATQWVAILSGLQLYRTYVQSTQRWQRHQPH